MLKTLLRTGKRHLFAVGSVLLLLLVLLVPSPSTSLGVLLYEVIRRCPDPRPELQSDSLFLVIGHRGSGGLAVENTMPSVQRALDVDSANALEIDLSMTADSVIILWHDWDPNTLVAEARESGTEPDVYARPLLPPDDSPYRTLIHRLSLEQVRAHYGYIHGETEERLSVPIPTFDEFFSWAVTKKRLRYLFLDIKVPEADSAIAAPMIARIERMVAEADPHFRVVYLTPYEGVYRALERAAPQADVSFDVEPPGGLILNPCSQSSVAHAISNGNRSASMVVPFTSTMAPWTTARRIIECDTETRLAHNRSGAAVPIDVVVASTLNDADKIECLIGLGVTGIITDFPQRLRQVARAMGKRVE